jgi:hypothetical protein
LHAAAVYQVTPQASLQPSNPRHQACRFLRRLLGLRGFVIVAGFFLLVFGLVFLVFCFVGGGLLPLLKVAAPERPGKSMAKGKAVIDGVMIRNETKAKEPNAKKSRRGPHATIRNDTKYCGRN